MNGRSLRFRGEVARVAMGCGGRGKVQKEALAHASSSRGKWSLQDLAHQSRARLLRLTTYGLRFNPRPAQSQS
jgi:hypothetical protein